MSIVVLLVLLGSQARPAQFALLVTVEIALFAPQDTKAPAVPLVPLVTTQLLHPVLLAQPSTATA